MRNKLHYNFETWCLVGKTLHGKIMTHPSFGELKIKTILENGLSIMEHSFLIPKHFFIENFYSLLSPEDVSNLKIKWIKYRQSEKVCEERKRKKLEQELQIKKETEKQRRKKEKEAQVIFEKREAELDLKRQSFLPIANKYELNIKKLVDKQGPTPLVPILFKINEKKLLLNTEISWLENKAMQYKNTEYNNLLGIYFSLSYKKELYFGNSFPLLLISKFLGENRENREEDVWDLAKACKYFRKARRSEKTIEISDEFIKSIHINNSPACAAVFTSRGGAFKDLEKVEEAKQHGLKAIELSPNSFHPYNLLGAICFLENDRQNGEKYFEKALELGSSPQIQEDELIKILKESEQNQNREDIINYLLEKDSKTYAWVSDFKNKINKKEKKN